MANNQIAQQIEGLIGAATNTVMSFCLFGPKNVGKESLVIDIASRNGFNIVPVSASSMIREWKESRGIERLLQQASDLAPCFLIITDFDLLFTPR